MVCCVFLNLFKFKYIKANYIATNKNKIFLCDTIIILCLIIKKCIIKHNVCIVRCL